MRYTFLILTIFIFGKIDSQDLNSYFYYSLFNSPQDPYVETYMSIIGNTTKFVKNKENKFASQLEITMIFKQNDTIKTFKKYRLSSPEISNLKDSKPNFIDLQRIYLPNGIYNFELKIKDINTDSKPQYFYDIIDVNFNQKDLSFSGIEYIEKYTKTTEKNILTKNNYDLIPYIADFYPKNFNKLSFYCEVYNLNKMLGDSANFLVKYYIETAQNDTKNQISGFQRQKANNINVVFSSLNIKDLFSGNYNLVIDIIDDKNNILATKKSFFQRSNPIVYNADNIKSIDISKTFVDDLLKDSLRLYLDYLYPIANINERQFIKNQLNNNDSIMMKKFFYNFWSKRNPLNPDEEWAIYLKQVYKVNSNYSTQVKKGYLSDRGRVFLQYGAPNDINESKFSPSTYPYEIWHYYKIGTQTNRRFVFYNPNLVGDDYELLHSDARGEVYLANWKLYLDKRNTPIYNQSQTKEENSHWGEEIDENYRK